MQSGGKKREPTLKELMAAQGKIKQQPQPQKAQPAPKKAQPAPQKAQPAPKKAQPAAKPRTEAEKKRQTEELIKAFNAQPSPKKAPTKEDKLRDLVNGDPEKAAQMLRELFLKGK